MHVLTEERHVVTYKWTSMVVHLLLPTMLPRLLVAALLVRDGALTVKLVLPWIVRNIKNYVQVVWVTDRMMLRSS